MRLIANVLSVHTADAEKLLLTDLSEEEFIETQKKLFRAVARLENLNNN